MPAKADGSSDDQKTNEAKGTDANEEEQLLIQLDDDNAVDMPVTSPNDSKAKDKSKCGLISSLEG